MRWAPVTSGSSSVWSAERLVAGFATGAGRPLQGRGGSPGFRFALYAIVSIACMVLDQRFNWLQRAHYILQAGSYPVELAVSSPIAAWRRVQSSFASRDSLAAENQLLRTRVRDLELRSMRYDALAQENAALIGLRNSLPPVAQRWLPADIVNIQLDSLRQRVLIDRGSVNGVTAGQAVLDDQGVVGQTMHVGPWSAQVILITDPEHALPVQIERTGLQNDRRRGRRLDLACPALLARQCRRPCGRCARHLGPRRSVSSGVPGRPRDGGAQGYGAATGARARRAVRTPRYRQRGHADLVPS